MCLVAEVLQSGGSGIGVVDRDVSEPAGRHAGLADLRSSGMRPATGISPAFNSV
jgi:hypothetical protein